MSNFVRIMFGGMGTSITSTLWDRRTSLHHSQLTEYTGPHSPAFTEAVHNLTAQGMPEPAAWATIERLITVKAATQGATDIFWISAVLFLMLIALVWLTKPQRSSIPIDAGGAH